jgi:hypothetical protein
VAAARPGRGRLRPAAALGAAGDRRGGGDLGRAAAGRPARLGGHRGASPGHRRAGRLRCAGQRPAARRAGPAARPRPGPRAAVPAGAAGRRRRATARAAPDPGRRARARLLLPLRVVLRRARRPGTVAAPGRAGRGRRPVRRPVRPPADADRDQHPRAADRPGVLAALHARAVRAGVVPRGAAARLLLVPAGRLDRLGLAAGPRRRPGRPGRCVRPGSGRRTPPYDLHRRLDGRRGRSRRRRPARLPVPAAVRRPARRRAARPLALAMAGPAARRPGAADPGAAARGEKPRDRSRPRRPVPPALAVGLAAPAAPRVPAGPPARPGRTSWRSR